MSPGPHQLDRVVALEEIKQEPQTRGVLALKLGIVRKREPRLVARCFEQGLMLGQGGDMEQRQSALSRAEQLASAAKPQILLGDYEPVLGAAHHVQPLARRVRQGLAVKQDARRFLGATADAPAQLM